MDHVLDVVGQVGFRRDDAIERGVHAVDRVATGPPRSLFAVILRQVGQQFADHAAALGVARGDEMAHSADRVMRHRSAQRFLGDVFVGHRLNHVGTSDEHVAGVLHHEDEIGDGGRVDRAARAGAHDGRDLRHHAACQRIAQEDIGVTRQRNHAFLYARSAGIVEPDHRRPSLQGQIHNLANLLRIALGERSPEDREILREDVDQAAFDAAVTGDEAIAGDYCRIHAEIAAAMRHQHVEFLEGVLVQQQFDALAGAEFALLVLAGAAFRPSALFGGLVAAA